MIPREVCAKHLSNREYLLRLKNPLVFVYKYSQNIAR